MPILYPKTFIIFINSVMKKKIYDDVDEEYIQLLASLLCEQSFQRKKKKWIFIIWFYRQINGILVLILDF